jgi:hypothetical protein
MKVWESSAPASVSLKRGSGYFSGASYRVEVTKDGYDKSTVQISSGLNAGWYLLGNALVGGLIGWLIVDPISGAMWSLAPEKINSELSKKLALNTEKGALVVVLRQQLPPEVFSDLQPVRIN